VRALVYRAELAVAMDLPDEALPPLAALHDEPLDDAGRAALAPELARASELARELGVGREGPGPTG